MSDQITQAAIPHMEEGSTIAFNASINMAVGHPELIDYTATKGAMVGFMRALSNQIVGNKGIRCNAVAPGPIWTPLMYVGSLSCVPRDAYEGCSASVC